MVCPQHGTAVLKGLPREPGLFTGHNPTRGSGQEILKFHRSGRVGSDRGRRFSNSYGSSPAILTRPDSRGLTQPENSPGFSAPSKSQESSSCVTTVRGGGAHRNTAGHSREHSCYHLPEKQKRRFFSLSCFAQTETLPHLRGRSSTDRSHLI